jgi:hypothetical protein
LAKHARGVHRVLDREWYTVQRAQLRTIGHSLIRGVRSLERAVGHQGHDRIDLGIHGFDAVQMRLHDFA